VSIPVAWGEMDAFQHVNNVIYARWIETARMAYLDRIGGSSFTMSFRIRSEVLGTDVASEEQVMVVYDYRAGATARRSSRSSGILACSTSTGCPARTARPRFRGRRGSTSWASPTLPRATSARCPSTPGASLGGWQGDRRSNLGARG
jgi:hypothetical protein